MNLSEIIDYVTANPLKDSVALYNMNSELQIKKFSDKKTAIKRLDALFAAKPAKLADSALAEFTGETNIADAVDAAADKLQENEDASIKAGAKKLVNSERNAIVSIKDNTEPKVKKLGRGQIRMQYIREAIEAGEKISYQQVMEKFGVPQKSVASDFFYVRKAGTAIQREYDAERKIWLFFGE